MQRRLYLDSSDIIRLADGVADAAQLEALRAAMLETGTRLTLSRAHTWDGLSRVDAARAERVIRVVESFEPILMVVDGPDVVEPIWTDRPDVVVQPCSSFRELANAPQRGAWLSGHAGHAAAQGELGGAGPLVRQSARTRTLLMQSFVTLCAGRLGDDVEVIVAHWERELGPMNAVDRTTVMIQLRKVRELLRSESKTTNADMRTTKISDMTAVLQALSAVGDDPLSYPGRRIGMVVATAKQRDLARRLQRSDLLDIEHASHFPYVDVATCEAGIYQAITTSVANVGGPRSAALAPTGQLPRVIELLRERAAA